MSVDTEAGVLQPAFQLFIAGNTANSSRARSNLTAILDKLSLPATLEVIDVLENPGLALSLKIFTTPSLIFKSATQRVLIVGDLSDQQAVLAALNCRAAA